MRLFFRYSANLQPYRRSERSRNRHAILKIVNINPQKIKQKWKRFSFVYWQYASVCLLRQVLKPLILSKKQNKPLIRKNFPQIFAYVVKKQYLCTTFLNDIHNKDYSVVKTFRVGTTSPFFDADLFFDYIPLIEKNAWDSWDFWDSLIPTVSIVSKISCKFLHCTFCTFTLDSANSAESAERFFAWPTWQSWQSSTFCWSTLPYKFLHGDIDDIGDIASIATFASAFFHLLGTFFLLFFTTQLPSKR